MTERVASHCLTYFKPDLHKNELVKDEKSEDSKALMTQILVDTATMREKLKKEKKTVEKRVEELSSQMKESARFLEICFVSSQSLTWLVFFFFLSQIPNH